MTPERLEELMRGEPTTEQGFYGEGAVKRIALAACAEERRAALTEAALVAQERLSIGQDACSAIIDLRDKEQP